MDQFPTHQNQQSGSSEHPQGAYQNPYQQNIQNTPANKPPKPPANKPRTRVGANVWLAIILVVIIILLGIILGQEDSRIESEVNSEQSGAHVSVQGQPRTKAPQDGFLPIFVFEEKEKAEEVINGTQGKIGTREAERIVSGVITDPQLENTVYFATSSQDDQSRFVGIYKYNTQTFRWQRLFKKTIETETGSAPLLRVLAIEGDELVLLHDKLATEPGACDSLWLRDPGSLQTMRLSDPYSGFQPYALTESRRAQAETELSNCE